MKGMVHALHYFYMGWVVQAGEKERVITGVTLGQHWEIVCSKPSQFT